MLLRDTARLSRSTVSTKQVLPSTLFVEEEKEVEVEKEVETTPTLPPRECKEYLVKSASTSAIGVDVDADVANGGDDDADDNDIRADESDRVEEE